MKSFKTSGISLRGKRILITAGPTWVPIDNVRVISNTATAETGCLLAKEMLSQEAKVVLVLGPLAQRSKEKNLKIIRFRFYDELKDILIKELKSKKYDCLVHTAAVSDYKPDKVCAGKIKSGINNLKLILSPTAKIIDYAKKIDPGIFLVGFKFEPDITKSVLLGRARIFSRRSKVDLTVANTVLKGTYKAYILCEEKISGPFLNKASMVKNLVHKIGEYLCGN